MTRLPWTTIAESVALVAHGVTLRALVERAPSGYTWTLEEEDGTTVKSGTSRTRQGARAAVYRAARGTCYVLSVLRRRSGASPTQGTLPVEERRP